MIVGKSNFICFRIRKCSYGTTEWFNLVEEAKNYPVSIKRNIIGIVGEKIALNIINNITDDAYTIGNYYPNPDLVNDKGVKIEIKTTMRNNIFYSNKFWWHYPKTDNRSMEYDILKKFPIMKLLLSENFGLVDYGFVILKDNEYINWELPNRKNS
jgi:hypothetical protein